MGSWQGATSKGGQWTRLLAAVISPPLPPAPPPALHHFSLQTEMTLTWFWMTRHISRWCLNAHFVVSSPTSFCILLPLCACQTFILLSVAWSYSYMKCLHFVQAFVGRVVPRSGSALNFSLQKKKPSLAACLCQNTLLNKGRVVISERSRGKESLARARIEAPGANRRLPVCFSVFPFFACRCCQATCHSLVAHFDNGQRSKGVTDMARLHVIGHSKCLETVPKGFESDSP